MANHGAVARHGFQRRPNTWVERIVITGIVFIDQIGECCDRWPATWQGAGYVFMNLQRDRPCRRGYALRRSERLFLEVPAQNDYDDQGRQNAPCPHPQAMWWGWLVQANETNFFHVASSTDSDRVGREWFGVDVDLM